jgi:hypothetical protein
MYCGELLNKSLKFFLSRKNSMIMKIGKTNSSIRPGAVKCVESFKIVIKVVKPAVLGVNILLNKIVK